MNPMDNYIEEHQLYLGPNGQEFTGLSDNRVVHNETGNRTYVNQEEFDAEYIPLREPEKSNTTDTNQEITKILTDLQDMQNNLNNTVSEYKVIQVPLTEMESYSNKYSLEYFQLDSIHIINETTALIVFVQLSKRSAVLINENG